MLASWPAKTMSGKGRRVVVDAGVSGISTLDSCDGEMFDEAWVEREGWGEIDGDEGG